jgi:hypothetical protein
MPLPFNPKDVNNRVDLCLRSTDRAMLFSVVSVSKLL